MKRSLLALCLATGAFNTLAQQQIGIATDNYNTINSLYLNPANLGACKEKLAINFFSFGMGVDNNLGKLASFSDVSSGAGSGTFKLDGGTGKFDMTVPSIEMRGPSLLYRINRKHAVALTTRVRAFNQFSNFDKSLYLSITDPSSINTAAVGYNASNFNWTAHIWTETGLSYGGEVFSTDMFSVKVGATLRYLSGIGYVGFKGRNMDVNYTAANDSFSANNTNVEFATNINAIDESLAENIASRLTGSKEGAKGIGADLGAVFTYKKSPEDDDYTGLFSIAIRDLGSITYKTSTFVTVAGTGSFKGSELDGNVDNYQKFRNFALSKGFTVDTGTASRKVYMPTTIMVGADYKAYKRIYVSATFIGNMTSTANFGSKYYTQLTITPRLQTKVFTAALPLTFNSITNNLRVGMALRAYCFYVGSDDMMGLFASGYGANFYSGVMLPIYKKPRNRGGNN